MKNQVPAEAYSEIWGSYLQASALLSAQEYDATEAALAELKNKALAKLNEKPGGADESYGQIYSAWAILTKTINENHMGTLKECLNSTYKPVSATASRLSGIFKATQARVAKDHDYLAACGQLQQVVSGCTVDLANDLLVYEGLK